MPHTVLRAAAHRAGPWDDLGPNDRTGNRKGTGNVQTGHPYLAWASMEAAQFALRFQPAAQRFYQRKLAKRRNNTVLARKAVAHKLARACYYLMRDLVPYAATQAFG